jgi:TPR repeat protein
MDFTNITSLSGQDLYDQSLTFKQNGDYDNFSIYLVMSANKGYDLAKRDFEIKYIENKRITIYKEDYIKTTVFYEATQEYSYSLCVLGCIYLSNNRGKKYDCKLAKEYFEKASDNGFATYKLGIMHHIGYIGSHVDHIKSFELYNKALEQGSIAAANWVGLCYYRGHGVNKNYEKAKEYYELGLVKYPNYASIINNYGVLIKNGYGCTKDIAGAKELFAKSSDKGCSTASNSLAKIYYDERDYELAIKFYEKAVEQNHENAFITLSNIYKKGVKDKVAINFKKARDILEKGISYSTGTQLDKTVTQLCFLYKTCDFKDDMDYVIGYFMKINKPNYIGKIYGFDSLTLDKLKENIKMKEKIKSFKQESVAN